MRRMALWAALAVMGCGADGEDVSPWPPMSATGGVPSSSSGGAHPADVTGGAAPADGSGGTAEVTGGAPSACPPLVRELCICDDGSTGDRRCAADGSGWTSCNCWGAATGGAPATGGTSTGGVSLTGGAVATGGAATGGTVATGGVFVTGGAATGGAETGGAGTGGATATGEFRCVVELDGECAYRLYHPPPGDCSWWCLTVARYPNGARVGSVTTFHADCAWTVEQSPDSLAIYSCEQTTEYGVSVTCSRVHSPREGESVVIDPQNPPQLCYPL